MVKDQYNSYSVLLVGSLKKENVVAKVGSGGSSGRPLMNAPVKQVASGKGGDNGGDIIVERPNSGSGHDRRRGSIDFGLGASGRKETIGRTMVASAWPSWLASVAGEAIQGWEPRKAESFEKLEKIGQGTYSSVYKGRDLESGKIVAMKKVQFVNMDPESV